MIELQDIKQHYRWSELDEKNMLELAKFALKKTDEFSDRFKEFVLMFGGAEKSVPSSEVVAEHQDRVREWYTMLFSGKYDEDYTRMLFKVGLANAKLGLEPHYVNSAISFSREFINECVSDSFHDRTSRDSVRASVSKLLDMNLDLISSSYRQEELRHYFATSKIQKNIITAIEKFSFVLDTSLVLILSFMAMVAIVFVFAEIANIFLEPYAASTTVVKVLGDLLILWSVSELIQEGIKHTQGSKFAVRSFVAVGLAACIREILIASLGHQTETILALTVTTLSLGTVYYLLSKSQQTI